MSIEGEMQFESVRVEQKACVILQGYADHPSVKRILKCSKESVDTMECHFLPSHQGVCLAAPHRATLEDPTPCLHQSVLGPRL